MSLRQTVLIIDDAPATRHGLAKLLELRGYDTREARNGAHGVEMLRNEPGIRLVVLDFRMPGSDGSWFRQHQLEDPTIADIPVVVFTGAGDAETIRTTLRIEHILNKPISIDELLDIIGRYCAT